MQNLRACLVGTALLLTAGAAGAQKPTITHGIATGDVTASSALIWSRCDVAAEMIVEISSDPALASPRQKSARNDLERDGTAVVRVEDLEPATRYFYRVSCRNRSGTSAAETGSFRTAPAPSAARSVRFLVSGDLGGQGFCRHAEKGYEIFRAMAELETDFFIANGDMIYGDDPCPAQGPEGWPNVPGDFLAVGDPRVDWQNFDQVREIYLDHWRYNRADPHHREFLRHTPIYAQWDDHEVINDFGAGWAVWPKEAGRAGYPNLVRAGREALFAWNPIPRHPREPFRIYRSARWGRDVEIFLLDARSYRSANERPESPAAPKTMLGKEQLAWLIAALQKSDATWKVISSDVPLSVPTGSQADLYGRDAFATGDHPWEPASFATRTGFESELRSLLASLDRADVRNVLFVTTDVHYASTLRYQVDVDGDGDALLFHELISGPLNAATNPVPPRLDPTFRPVTLYAEAGLFNFSYVRIERRGDDVVLTADVRDKTGEARFGSRLELVAEKP